MRTFRLAVIAVAVVVSGASLMAQSTAAGVVGIIRDATGAAVPGASIKVQNAGTNLSRVGASNERGEFTVTNLAPGIYNVVIEKAGFQTLRQTDLELQVNQTARLELQLQIGAVSESVEVKADVPLLNTENATRGDVITNQEILEMPLDGRDVSDLAYLVPGVTPMAEGDLGSGYVINGARPDNSNFTIGGFGMRDPRYGQAQARPTLDAVQEFKMETAGYSAEHGRLAGGVMSMVLKSGSNQVHGTLFEFVRNDMFDARNFFAQDKNKLRRNQFGAVVSGPVWLPKIYNGRDRTFFLFNWESMRDSMGNTKLSRVPTDLERQGDFSETRDVSGKLVALKDPLVTGSCGPNGSAACFPGNRIPASRFSPISTKVLPFWPSANRPGQVNNFATDAVTSSPWNNFTTKIDHKLSAKDSLSFQYLRRGNSNDLPFDSSNLGVFGSRQRNTQMQFGLTWTRMFTPTVINEFRTGLTRIKGNYTLYSHGHDYAQEFGIPGTTTDPELVGFPLFTVRDLVTLGDKNDRPYSGTVNMYQWGDTLTWALGRHIVKTGGQVQRTQNFHPYVFNNRGTFNFLGNWTSQPLGDFLLGMPESASRQTTVPRNYLFSTEYGAFLQDDWKLNSRLTLNLGVRYDLAMPASDKYGRFANFVPEIGRIIISDDVTVPNLMELAAGVGLTDKIGVARDYGLPKSLVNPNYKRVAPRFGLAWRPFGGNRMVIRSGYGIFYGAGSQEPVTDDLANIFPFAVKQTVNRQASDPTALTLADPYRAAKGGNINFAGYELSPKSQYLQSWNLAIEREIGKSAAIEISYTGSKGTHLPRKYDVNQPFYKPELKLPTGGYPRPFPQINNAINFYALGSNSTYNAGTVTLRRRFSSGFFYRLNYTYSKSIDESSNYGGAAAQDSRNLRLERGRSNWDRGHVFTLDYSYQFPWRERSGWSRLAGGWQLAGTGRAQSGSPFTPATSNVNLNTGGAIRPDRLAKGTASNLTPDAWFDISAFSVVPAGSYRLGNSGRNILDGPGFLAVNLSLIKNTKIGERGKLQFRWEVFNAFNHTNFNRPNANVNAINGGTIVGAGAARTMQLGLRYQF